MISGNIFEVLYLPSGEEFLGRETADNREEQK